LKSKYFIIVKRAEAMASLQPEVDYGDVDVVAILTSGYGFLLNCSFWDDVVRHAGYFDGSCCSVLRLPNIPRVFIFMQQCGWLALEVRR
jgi:hypothetical protein